jgi:hypothetical protein
VVDSEERVVAMCVGHPRDDDWDTVHMDGINAFKKASEQCRFSSEQTDHRRGEFPALATGVSFGGGQKACCPQFLFYVASADATAGPR